MTEAQTNHRYYLAAAEPVEDQKTASVKKNGQTASGFSGSDYAIPIGTSAFAPPRQWTDRGNLTVAG